MLEEVGAPCYIRDTMQNRLPTPFSTRYLAVDSWVGGDKIDGCGCMFACVCCLCLRGTIG